MKLALSSLCAILWTASVYAQDEVWIPEALPPHLDARVSAQESALLLDDLSAPQRGLIDIVKLWNTAQPIKVCFFGGSQPLRARIASLAIEWTQAGAYLPLDFGNLANPRLCSASDYNHIRVGYQYKGYWSLVGTDSVTLASQLEQSMNLSMFDVVPPDDQTFRRVVLHEFGHAIGLHHEHQSYKSPCPDEFKWDFIYTYLAGPPNYWSTETTDHNLRPISGEGIVPTNPDRDSIMLYSFPVSFYKGGAGSQCYTPGNTTLSAGDKQILATYYTSTPGGAVASAAAAFEDFAAAVGELDVSAEQRLSATLSAAQIRAASEATATMASQPGGIFGPAMLPGFGSTAFQPAINLQLQ